MIKLVTIDLDGTLFDKNKNISLKNKEAIKKARQKGCKIVIATGRPIAGVKPVLEQLEMNTKDDYVIVYNGAKVYNVATNETIFSSTISGKDVKELYYESKRLASHYHAFKENEELITAMQNPYTDVECRINKIKAIDVNFDDIADDEKFLKTMLVCDEKTLDNAMININPKIKENYSMVRSADIFLEFLNKNSHKGHALRALAKYLNIDLSETMAIGDAGNDLPMIEIAGIGVAMANSFDYVKEAADYLTLSNEEDGVAHAIEKFVLED